MRSRPDVGVEAETPLLEAVSVPWPQEKQPQSDTSTPLLRMSPESHRPNWLIARRDKHGRRLPQSIAHRGYKAQHPENTLKAFIGAAKADANAIETDIHLSKDGVVVLSHDADLKRCFGVKKKIIDCDWSYLNRLRTTKPPHEPMPRLKDLLSYVAQPGLEHLWLLLDIKVDNNADDVMRLIAETIASVSPNPSRPWRDRILLGIWVAKYLPLCTKYASGFPITHIGFSMTYARQFLQVPNVGFNMLQKMLVGANGIQFIKEVKEAGREILVWTVNQPNMMKWSIQKEVDGVITDDPKTFNEICDEWTGNEPPMQLTWMQWLQTLWLHLLVLTIPILFKRKFPEMVEQATGKQGRQEVQARAAQKIAETQ